MGKYIFFSIFCFLTILLSSCNNSDEIPTRILPFEDSLDEWPLKQENQWIFYRDTLTDTLRIDTSFVYNNFEVFKSKGIKSLLLPSYFNKDSLSSYFTKQDSIFKIQIPASSFLENNVYMELSDVSIPIYKQNLEVNKNYTGFTQFTITENGVTEQIQLDFDVKVLEKNSREAIGGRVFQNITKIENSYSFTPSTSINNFTLSIWLEPGIGPVKIIKNNQESIYLLKSYQIIQ